MCYPCTHCNKCGKFPKPGTCPACQFENDEKALVCARCGFIFPRPVPEPGVRVKTGQKS